MLNLLEEKFLVPSPSRLRETSGSGGEWCQGRGERPGDEVAERQRPRVC